MSSVVLVQPGAAGRVSGGYLYNEKMRVHGAWQVQEVDPQQLPGWQLPDDTGALLLDSIWLTPQYLPYFEPSILRSSVKCAVVLHSLPSRIVASEAGRDVQYQPSAFERKALGQLDGVVAVGPYYPQLLGDSVRRVVLASPGMEDAWRCPPRPRAGPCRLVSIGGVSPRKGFLDVAKALRSLPADLDWQWDVIGSLQLDAGYSEQLRQACVVFGSAVRLHGQLQPEQTRQMVQQSDVLVMPSYDENHPLVLLEAIAASTVPVAYAAGAASEMVGHDRCGLVAPIGDVSALAGHLRSILQDEPRRFEMAQACWQAQKALPSWPQAAEAARRQLLSWAGSN